MISRTFLDINLQSLQSVLVISVLSLLQASQKIKSHTFKSEICDSHNPLLIIPIARNKSYFNIRRLCHTTAVMIRNVQFISTNYYLRVLVPSQL